MIYTKKIITKNNVFFPFLRFIVYRKIKMVNFLIKLINKFYFRINIQKFVIILITRRCSGHATEPVKKGQLRSLANFFPGLYRLNSVSTKKITFSYNLSPSNQLLCGKYTCWHANSLMLSSTNT